MSRGAYHSQVTGATPIDPRLLMAFLLSIHPVNPQPRLIRQAVELDLNPAYIPDIDEIERRLQEVVSKP